MKKRNIIILLIIIVVIAAIAISSVIISSKISERDSRIKKEKQEKEVLSLIDGKISVQIYMITEATDEQINKLEEDIWSAIGENRIQSIEFVSKEQALERMKASFEDADWIFDGYQGENNIFPVSYIITLKINDFNDFSKKYFEAVEKDLLSLDNVDKVQMNGPVYLEMYEKGGLKGLKEYIETEDRVTK